MSSWDGATAIVTGAASGIGLALSMGLARRGAEVWLTDVNGAGAQQAAEAIGPRAHSARLDVRDGLAVRGFVERVARDRGRLDFMFNNAGIGVGGEISDLALQHWDRILDINVRGVVHGVTAAYPLMQKQRKGHIVNTASLAGLTPVGLLVPYAMTKHAVVGLSTSLRVEAAAHGVRVSALCPAAIETPLLDADNPKDLPQLAWRPDVRRYLTQLCGPPYPADKLADDALNGIERNRAVIVVPGRARVVYALSRLLPGLVDLAGRKAVADVRKQRPSY